MSSISITSEEAVTLPAAVSSIEDVAKVEATPATKVAAKVDTPSLSEAIASFKDTLSGKSPRTLETYTVGLRQLCAYVGTVLKLKPEEVAVGDLPESLLEDFYNWLVLERGREARMTIGTYIAASRAFCRYLDRRRWLPNGTSFERMAGDLRAVMGRAPSYRTPRIDSRIPLIVMAAERAELPAGGEEHMKQQKRLELLRDRAVLHTLFSTGLRREEVSRLNRADIADGNKAQALITGKGDKERVVFFGAEALTAIRAYIAARQDSYQPLFIRHDKGRGKVKRGGTNYRLGPHSIWKIVKAWAVLAGIEASTHDFRHAKASTLLNRGAQLSEVQDLLGHASPETTKKIYAHYTTSHLREAFERFSVSPAEAAAELDEAKAKS